MAKRGTWPGTAAGETPGAPRKHPIQLTTYEREALLLIARSRQSTRFAVLQARIVLLAADGMANRAIARRLDIKLDTVLRWRERFYRRRLDGLKRLPDGRPPKAVRGNWDQTVGAIEAAKVEPSGKLERPWTLIERAPPGPNSRVNALAELLPPGRPPCFDSDDRWRDYMQHAAAQARHANQSPVIWLAQVPTLNARFNFCEDCAAAHQHRMMGLERCDPGWLQREGQA